MGWQKTTSSTDATEGILVAPEEVDVIATA
jgi:hypothetical protein